MKTLKEIKEDYATNLGFEDWIDMLRNTGDLSHDAIVDIVAKAYAYSVAKEALNNASKVADKLRENGDLVKKIILHHSNIPTL